MGRNGLGGASRPAPQRFWRESDKSWEREGKALAFRKASFLIDLRPSLRACLRTLRRARHRKPDRLVVGEPVFMFFHEQHPNQP